MSPWFGTIKQNVRPLCSYLVLKWKVDQNNKVNKRNCRMKDHSDDQTEWNLLYFRCDSRLKLYCLRLDLLNGKKKLVIPFCMNKDAHKEHFLKRQIRAAESFPSLQLFKTATILGRSDCDGDCIKRLRKQQSFRFGIYTTCANQIRTNSRRHQDNVHILLQRGAALTWYRGSIIIYYCTQFHIHLSKKKKKSFSMVAHAKKNMAIPWCFYFLLVYAFIYFKSFM